jgi:hypothetical protein
MCMYACMCVRVCATNMCTDNLCVCMHVFVCMCVRHTCEHKMHACMHITYVHIHIHQTRAHNDMNTQHAFLVFWSGIGGECTLACTHTHTHTQTYIHTYTCSTHFSDTGQASAASSPQSGGRSGTRTLPKASAPPLCLLCPAQASSKSSRSCRGIPCS